ncbi:MAG: dTDP-glucose 4,6-dehydratase [Spirochaetaceae bacterium]|nr:dTDP-glucose 4,6-dehydratase [Spirochaetaceae bacterium]
MRKLTNLLVTGGAGFIGCNFIRALLENTPDFAGRIVNLDVLTYAGSTENLAGVEERFGGKRYFFERGDICDRELVDRVFSAYGIDTVVHFAAESHVDRSILGPAAFINSNIIGTFTLLEAASSAWKGPGGAWREGVHFHHISTDEVYGSLGETGSSPEDAPYAPRSPYSASKAASDHLVFAYHHTYGLPVTLSNCSNNYGPYQFPEKFIPLSIMNILAGKPLPVYGDGKNIRDWIYVEDHAAALWMILRDGKNGNRYNVGANDEWENIKLLERLIAIICRKRGLDPLAVAKTITFVTDRPGHDRRYALDCGKIRRELGWRPKTGLEEGLERTIDFYVSRAGLDP